MRVCSTECGRAAAIAEKMGIPTVMVTREGFSKVITNTFAGEKFPAEASQVIFPLNMFLPGSDLTPIEEKTDELIDGLTKWEPIMKETGVISPPPLIMEGKDYEEDVKRYL